MRSVCLESIIKSLESNLLFPVQRDSVSGEDRGQAAIGMGGELGKGSSSEN